MTSTQSSIPLDRIRIRSYRDEDGHAVHQLYEEGRLAGQVQPNDTAADIDNIHEAYQSQDRCHFWVAECDGSVIGMVGVAEEDRNLAEIRRLRVDPHFRFHDPEGHGLEHLLMDTALGFCRHHGYLKVVLDTAFEQDGAKHLFEKFAFQHNRTRTIGGKELLEFYLDLYHQPKTEEKK